MYGNVKATEVLNGSFGYLQLDGVDWGELSGFQSQIEVGYEDVQRGLDIDAKMITRKGTGTISLNKVYSRAASMVDKVKAGKQPKANVVAWIKDPDSPGNKMERVAIKDIKFTTLDVLTFTNGQTVKSEYPFTFIVDNLTYLDRI